MCDFGLSRAVPDVRYYKKTGDPRKVPFTQLAGSAGYLAPELLLRRSYGVEVDVWAAGACGGASALASACGRPRPADSPRRIAQA